MNPKTARILNSLFLERPSRGQMPSSSKRKLSISEDLLKKGSRNYTRRCSPGGWGRLCFSHLKDLIISGGLLGLPLEVGR